jgi:type IV fimbrial biogenesis protein FimT
MKRFKRPARGFSLIELMVTISVAVILVAIAIPSFVDITVTNKLSSTSNDLISALTSARIEAIKSNTNISVCADNTNICSVQKGSTTLRNGITGITAPIQIQNVTALIFSGQGLAHSSGNTTPYSGLVADIYTTRISTNNHRCVYMSAGGSVLQTCTITSLGACPNAQPASCTQ